MRGWLRADRAKELPTNDFCGLIMPISEIDGCSESHWQDVKSVLTEAIELCGLKANIVSNADEVGVIQKRIVENLYYYPVVVCDVSGKNPNVMLELGMRLAFDKPVIIVKDDCTSYSFDTSPVEHLTYPRDLRFAKIVAFQKLLSEKLLATLEMAQSDLTYSPFLKAFGDFSLPKVSQKEISAQEYMMQQLDGINLTLSRLTRDSRQTRSGGNMRLPSGDAIICAKGWNTAKIIDAMQGLHQLDFVDTAKRHLISEGHEHIVVNFNRITNSQDTDKLIAISPRTRIAAGRQ